MAPCWAPPSAYMLAIDLSSNDFVQEVEAYWNGQQIVQGCEPVIKLRMQNTSRTRDAGRT